VWENFIEELLSVWAYLWLSPEEKKQLLGEEPEEDEEKGDSSDQNQE